jgi:hypothetical protein
MVQFARRKATKSTAFLCHKGALGAVDNVATFKCCLRAVDVAALQRKDLLARLQQLLQNGGKA